ncbi:MAG: MBL fold metallo-hydrolase [Candidatus Methylacidiphilales bacterium]|nr:MBL fold metallo-hydrolase [Candidatus Methylacidiphilales bacterium]
MTRFCALFFCFLTLLPVIGVAAPNGRLPVRPAQQTESTTPAPPTPAPLPAPASTPAEPTEGTLARWFGHAFVFLTSQSGVRIALNPFTEGTVDYKIPDNLPAEIVLISSESSDHSGGQHIFGIPQIFRSLAGVGANRANGIPFRGINTWRDAEGGKRLGRNTVYVIEVDGLRFCHLGTLGHPLGSRDVSAIGQVDVLFLPVGTLDLSPREILRNAELLGAKWIVPITYKTPKNTKVDLRPLDAIDFTAFPVRKLDGSEYRFSAKTLPSQPTVLEWRDP